MRAKINIERYNKSVETIQKITEKPKCVFKKMLKSLNQPQLIFF